MNAATPSSGHPAIIAARLVRLIVMGVSWPDRDGPRAIGIEPKIVFILNICIFLFTDRHPFAFPYAPSGIRPVRFKLDVWCTSAGEAGGGAVSDADICERYRGGALRWRPKKPKQRPETNGFRKRFVVFSAELCHSNDPGLAPKHYRGTKALSRYPGGSDPASRIS